MKKKTKQQEPQTQAKEWVFEVIRTPVVTEKSTRLSENNQVVFKVALDATKDQIKQAVESLFKVKVTGVNTIHIRGKNKRFKGMLGKRPDFKKAVVSLAQGQSIDVMAGI